MKSEVTADSRNVRWRLLVLASLLIGLSLTVAHALTKIPHVDEGDLGSAAISIIEKGYMSFPYSYSYLPSFRQDYLLPPFYFYTLAGWFSVAGRTIEAYRLYHVVWWLMMTVCWISVVRSTSRSAVGVVFGAVLLSLNYDTINLGISRYDIVTAALNASAVASYLLWRRGNFDRAVVAANLCLALAAITHPHAIFGLITCILLVSFTGDWRRIRVRHLFIALVPYVLTFGAWAILIDGRWELFLDQMMYGARTKRGFTGNPLMAVATDARERWWELFAGWREGVPAVMKVKTVFLVMWLAGIMTALVAKRTDESSAIRRSIALSALAIAVALAFIDTTHLQIYVINVVPPAAAAVALMLESLWDEHPAVRRLTAGAVAGMGLFAIASILFRVRANDLNEKFKPVAKLVSDSIMASDVLISPSEMAYARQFSVDLRSDPRLSSIGTGKLPSMIVRSEEQGDLTLPREVPCQHRDGNLADSAFYKDITPRSAASEYRVYLRQKESVHSGEMSLLVRSCLPN